MGTTYCIFIFLLLAILPSVSISSWASTNTYSKEISAQCGYTRYPNLCLQTLSRIGSKNQNTDLLYALVNRTISETRLPRSNFVELSSHFVSLQAQQARSAIHECQELTEMALRRLNQAKEAIQKSPERYKEDIQTWLSAAITFLETCKDTAEDHVQSNAALSEIHRKMDYLSELCSNPLALANRITRNPTGELPTRSRRLVGGQKFPSWVSKRDRRLLESGAIEADAVVAKDGSGDFDTISDAIQSAKGGRYVIYVKSGDYNEKISTSKDGITLIGDGKYSTIIYASSSVGKGSSLRGSSTFSITGDGFIARDIGFQNTAGASAGQAIALTVASDRAVLYRCSLVGNQDTLYALSLRQFYRECDIYGTVDYIFGNAAAVFQGCSIILQRPRISGGYDVILANGRSDPGQNTGFSLQDCKITGSSGGHNAYLGRPWKEYSRAVVMQSSIDGVVQSRGWIEWPGYGSSVYKTLYFGEYDNNGAGSGTSGRVGWPGFHVLDTPEASKFTVANFIGGNSWLPSTGVTFVSGLQ
ncbi:plant invertase/pectin methylesterase inhibitor superfamily [Dorcoceras hygrometricum]|uniref:Pectinesterase n=1 Tax=Dorcoceras hygrometricum TaxID=472368 RepID=A0A2Z7CCG9_9LAMI|nr:plant invertase/pectin methylesterase inhibitor superfamily [Dorcoceras hygrometricum]